MKSALLALALSQLAPAGVCRAQQEPAPQSPALPYVIVDTAQRQIFDDRSQLLKAPAPNEPFFGQDGFFRSHPPSYTLASDGLTVHDNNTGLTWQRSPDVDGDGAMTAADKLTFRQAQARPAALNAAKFGGYADWRLPTIKELYSLIDFRGTDPSGYRGSDTSVLKPFIDTRYFKFFYGQASLGDRIIDSQYATRTLYVNKNWWGSPKLFGVNFADGRIKGYDLDMPRGQKTFCVMCVRGNPRYGINDLVDNGDNTITDRATGLMWAKPDSGKGMNWQAALAWVQARNRENYLGHSDWRLPSAKELQSIVDYTRSPDSSRSAAISPLFDCTPITNEAHQPDYACYWTATTHGTAGGRAAVYVAFGRALGFMGNTWRDVHGAGAQRSDPKSGDARQFPQGRGPQGDAIRIDNFVRPVRSVDPASIQQVQPDLTPLPAMRIPMGPPDGPPNGFGRPRRGPGRPGGPPPGFDGPPGPGGPPFPPPWR